MKKREIVENTAGTLSALLFALALYPAFLKFGTAFFIDLRTRQIIARSETLLRDCITAGAASVLISFGALLALKHSGHGVKTYICANLPLISAAVMWFMYPTFPALLFCVFMVIWSAGRTASLCTPERLPAIDHRKALFIITAAVLLSSLAGTWHQLRSFDTLGMAWFDWGHFYESLLNTLDGKPFYLNLCRGSFLGVRFTPTLLLLLPAAAIGKPGVFLFAGSLLVSSGALFVYLISRSLKAGVRESLFMGLWYLFIPGVANMNLPLIDGFHEVFMLFPLVTGCVWCVLEKRYRTAAVLFLLSLGVRETAGVIFAGYGIVLFLLGKRKAGAVLFAISLVYVVTVINFVMPLFDAPVKGTYAHVRFFSHLGGNIGEIMLSPVTRPGTLLKSLFNIRNFSFYLTILVPFCLLAVCGYRWLLPLVPELVMISLDRRFDTQTVLRHYQISVVLVLVVASLAGARLLREKSHPAWVKWLFWKLKNPDVRLGALGMSGAGALLGFLFFVHLPGLPASEPQRRFTESEGVAVYADATSLAKRIKSLIPAGAKVSTGPRVGSLLVGEYDVFIDPACDEKSLQEYVILENFSRFYSPEDKISRMLIKSPYWQMLHQEFVDERSIQLFRRVQNAVPKRNPCLRVPERVWASFGARVPVPSDSIELKAAANAPGRIVFGVKILKKRTNDAAFKVELETVSGRKIKHFTSFCNGRYPADLAEPGDIFFFKVEYPPAEQIKFCQVNLIEIAGMEVPR